MPNSDEMNKAAAEVLQEMSKMTDDEFRAEIQRHMTEKPASDVWDELQREGYGYEQKHHELIERAIAAGRALERVADACRGMTHRSEELAKALQALGAKDGE